MPITEAVYGKKVRRRKKAAPKERHVPVTTIRQTLSADTLDALDAMKHKLRYPRRRKGPKA
jgi:hypothetical protein